MTLLVTNQKNCSGRLEVQSSDIRIVSEDSQEMFLEYAHYLPERAVMSIVNKLREFVMEEMADVDLKTPLNAANVASHFNAINEGVTSPAPLPHQKHICPNKNDS